MKTGILKRRHRDEIINSFSTLILIRPTPDDYTTVCRRLVEKYPNLKDKVDSGYVSTSLPTHYFVILWISWRKKLRTKFKYLRRLSRSAKARITVSPPSKHSKKQDDANASGSDDPNAYERNVEFLQRSYHSKQWSVSSLLGETAKQRRH